MNTNDDDDDDGGGGDYCAYQKLFTLGLHSLQSFENALGIRFFATRCSL